MSKREIDTPWRRWSAFGKLGHAAALGGSGQLLESGWLSRECAAEVLGVSLSTLDELVRIGVVRARSIGPGVRLYRV